MFPPSMVFQDFIFFIINMSFSILYCGGKLNQRYHFTSPNVACAGPFTGPTTWCGWCAARSGTTSRSGVVTDCEPWIVSPQLTFVAGCQRSRVYWQPHLLDFAFVLNISKRLLSKHEKQDLSWLGCLSLFSRDRILIQWRVYNTWLFLGVQHMQRFCRAVVPAVACTFVEKVCVGTS